MPSRNRLSNVGTGSLQRRKRRERCAQDYICCLLLHNVSSDVKLRAFLNSPFFCNTDKSVVKTPARLSQPNLDPKAEAKSGTLLQPGQFQGWMALHRHLRPGSVRISRRVVIATPGPFPTPTNFRLQHMILAVDHLIWLS